MIVRVKKAVDQLLGWALVGLFSTLVLDVLWQVLSRYVLGAPASYTEEVARFSFMWLALLSAAYVAGQRGHLAIDLLPQALTPERRRTLQTGLTLLSLAFVFTVLIGGGVSLVTTSLELGQRSPVLGVPLGWVYLVVPIAGVLFGFYLLLELARFGETEEAEQ